MSGRGFLESPRGKMTILLNCDLRERKVPLFIRKKTNGSGNVEKGSRDLNQNEDVRVSPRRGVEELVRQGEKKANVQWVQKRNFEGNSSCEQRRMASRLGIA